MINKTIVNDFSKIIGNIEIVIQLDSFSDVKKDYEIILDTLLQWVKYYYNNGNFEIITHNESLKIHELLEEIKWKMITNKNIGDESILTDDILIRYEVIMKTINDERKLENGKR